MLLTLEFTCRNCFWQWSTQNFQIGNFQKNSCCYHFSLVNVTHFYSMNLESFTFKRKSMRKQSNTLKSVLILSRIPTPPSLYGPQLYVIWDILTENRSRLLLILGITQQQGNTFYRLLKILQFRNRGMEL
jgi:hypothetical protein